ncbi:MAG: hypothetical protein K6E75_11205 [Lachnospiraceae bacterium]|nr:hypothetical protein [Lachnospiraceae bacterium]
MGGKPIEAASDRIRRLAKEEQKLEDEKIIAEKDKEIAELKALLAKTNQTVS